MGDTLMFIPNDDEIITSLKDFNYWLKNFTDLEPTNHNSLSAHKVFDLTNKIMWLYNFMHQYNLQSNLPSLPANTQHYNDSLVLFL